MPTEAIITLEDLECITIKDNETKVEPYIWPALIKIDTSTINAPDGRFVDVIALSPSVASVVIKNSMQQGDLAPIPASVATLRTRFEDGVTLKRLILIVSLLEMDETPKGAIRAGFEAYVRELRAAFKDEFPNLFQAESVNDDEGEKAIIKRIKDRVESKTKSAIKDALSAGDKIKSALGFLDNDDFISSSNIKFGENFFLNTPNAAPITLVFQKNVAFIEQAFPPKVAQGLVRYHIRARLQARPPVINPCQSQVTAVNTAQAVVDGIKNEIEELQGEFPKGANNAEIERIRKEELTPALAELEKAKKALQLCRSQQS
jgi:hypothetical protein